MEQKTAILIGGDNWKNLLEDYISKHGEENLEVLLSIPLSKANEEYCRKLSHLITFKNFYKNKPNNINMNEYVTTDNIIDLQDNNNNDNNKLPNNTLLQGVTMHLLGIPSLPIRDELRFSPYVGIAESMAEILHDLNLKTIHYGTEGSEIKCDESINLLSEVEFDEYARDKEPLLLTLHSFFHEQNKGLWNTYFERLKLELDLKLRRNTRGNIVLVPHSLYGEYLDDFRKV